jgi:histidyl-tRNA synthetase
VASRCRRWASAWATSCSASCSPTGGVLPEYRKSLDYFIVTVRSEAQRGEALRIAHAAARGREERGLCTAEQGVAKQLKAAGREGAREVLIVGPDELARGVRDWPGHGVGGASAR